MRHGLLAFCCLITVSPFAFAQTLDRAKFRQAIELPSIATNLGVHFRSQERDGRGNLFKPEEKIAELQKKLTGGPDDAEIYLEQRAVYLECSHDSANAEARLAKAEAILRPYLQSNDPRHGNLLAQYGAVLEAMSESAWHDKWTGKKKDADIIPAANLEARLYPWNDCEKLARRAVALSPNDWRVWTYLAHIRQMQIPTILCGGDDKRLSRDSRATEAIGMLYMRQARPEYVNEAEAALNEAAQCHDRAKQLAPADAKRQTQRYGFRLTETILRNAIARGRGKEIPYPMQQLERRVLDELEITAALNADHLLWQSQLVHQLAIVGWQAQADAINKKAEEDKKAGKTVNLANEQKVVKVFKVARTEDEKAIRDALSRIEKIADSSRGEPAAFAYSMLAALCSSMQQHAAVETYARKALQNDSKSQVAGEQLLQGLLLQNKQAEELAAADIVAKNNPSARNCYLLAKAQAHHQRYDLAEVTCRSGLTHNGADLYCLMGLSAVLMRKSDDAETLRTVGELLERARRECRPESGPLAQAELTYLLTVHQALSGEVAIARLKLLNMHSENPDNPRYEKLLSAFAR
jgi:hypothetical protein